MARMTINLHERVADDHGGRIVRVPGEAITATALAVQDLIDSLGCHGENLVHVGISFSSSAWNDPEKLEDKQSWCPHYLFQFRISEMNEGSRKEQGLVKISYPEQVGLTQDLYDSASLINVVLRQLKNKLDSKLSKMEEEKTRTTRWGEFLSERVRA